MLSCIFQLSKWAYSNCSDGYVALHFLFKLLFAKLQNLVTNSYEFPFFSFNLIMLGKTIHYIAERMEIKTEQKSKPSDK